MELNFDKQKQKLLNEANLEMEFWDKIFWQNHAIQIDNKFNAKNEVTQKINETLKELCNLEPDFFSIDTQKNPFLEKEIEHFQNGLADEETARFVSQHKQKIQTETALLWAERNMNDYQKLAEFLKNSNYPNSFKALVLEEALFNTFRFQGSKLLVEKRQPHKTICDLPNFSGIVIDHIFQNAKNGSSFKTLYKNAQDLFYAEKEKAEQSAKTKNLETFGKGTWIVFPSKAKDKTHFEKNVHDLKELINKNQIDWCTGHDSGDIQLAKGDFCVFVDNNKKPRIAVLLSGSTLEEIRGIKNGFSQEIEDEFRDVAIEFLQNNLHLANAKEWLAKEEWNERLVNYTKQIKNKTFQKQQIPFMLQDLVKDDYKAHFNENSNKVALREALQEINDMMCEHLKIPKNSKICYEFVTEGKARRNADAEYIFGSLCLFGFVARNGELKNIKKVFGSVSLKNCSIDLKNLETIGQNLSLYGNLENLDLGVLSVGKNVEAFGAEFTTLKNLEQVGGNMNLEQTEAFNAKNLCSVKGSLNLKHCQAHRFGALKNVGGEVTVESCKEISFPKLNHIGSSLDISKSENIDLNGLKNVDGMMIFVNTKNVQAKNLKKVKSEVICPPKKNQNVDLGNFEKQIAEEFASH